MTWICAAGRPAPPVRVWRLVEAWMKRACCSFSRSHNRRRVVDVVGMGARAVGQPNIRHHSQPRSRGPAQAPWISAAGPFPTRGKSTRQNRPEHVFPEIQPRRPAGEHASNRSRTTADAHALHGMVNRKSGTSFHLLNCAPAAPESPPRPQRIERRFKPCARNAATSRCKNVSEVFGKVVKRRTMTGRDELKRNASYGDKTQRPNSKANKIRIRFCDS